MAAPVITAQPQSVTVALGTTVKFSVKAAIGDGVAYITWSRKGGAMPADAIGATATLGIPAPPPTGGGGTGGTLLPLPSPIGGGATSTLTLPTVAAGDAGDYCCTIVKPAEGQVTSDFATLAITGVPSPYNPGGPLAPGPGTGTGTIIVGSGGLFAGLVPNLGTNGKDFYLDANYSVAQPVGLPTPTFPYLDQNNTNAVVFRQPYEQAITSYQPLDMTKPQGDLGGLYYFGDANMKDGQGGVYVFDRLFGNLPAQRIRRGQSCNYTFQFILKAGESISTSDDGSFDYQGPTYSIGSRVYSVDSVLIYDYFLDGDQAKYPLKRYPCIEMQGQAIGSRGEDFNGGDFPLGQDPTGLIIGKPGVTQILGEDDRYDEYRGAIKCRVRRLIAAPSAQTFINS